MGDFGDSAFRSEHCQNDRKMSILGLTFHLGLYVDPFNFVFLYAVFSEIDICNVQKNVKFWPNFDSRGPKL